MRKKRRGIAAALMALAMSLTMGQAAFAAADYATAKVPVTITESGSVPSAKQQYTFKLAARDASSPMPEAVGADGTSTLTVEGAGTFYFPDITYTRVGDYYYTLTMVQGNNGKCTYDTAPRYVKVCIRNKGGVIGELETATINMYPDEAMLQEKTSGFHTSFKSSGGHTPGGSGGDPDGPHGGNNPGGPGDGLTIPDEAPPLAEMIPESPIPLGNLPKTGDTTNIALWLALMAISGCGLIGLMMARKKMEA